MRFGFQSNIEAFWAQAEGLLLKNEAANSLLLGLCTKMKSENWTLPLLITIGEGKELVSVALQTPPSNLVLTFTQPVHLKMLAEKLWQRRCVIPGVVGPKEAAHAFAGFWHRQSGCRVMLGMEQGIYQISKVRMPASCEGTMRLARLKDARWIERSLEDFRREALSNEPQPRGRMKDVAEKRVQAGEFYLWEVGGKPVSMAGTAGPTQNGIRINAVFTPKAQRGKGFASALVAHLSQKMLKGGRRFCCLYTDLSNPTSNGIYQKIGYEPVCDSRHYIFNAKELASRGV